MLPFTPSDSKHQRIISWSPLFRLNRLALNNFNSKSIHLKAGGNCNQETIDRFYVYWTHKHQGRRDHWSMGIYTVGQHRYSYMRKQMHFKQLKNAEETRRNFIWKKKQYNVVAQWTPMEYAFKRWSTHFWPCHFCVWFIHIHAKLKTLGDSPPKRDPILSFSNTFLPKSARVGHFQREILDPQLQGKAKSDWFFFQLFVTVWLVA